MTATSSIYVPAIIGSIVEVRESVISLPCCNLFYRPTKNRLLSLSRLKTSERLPITSKKVFSGSALCGLQDDNSERHKDSEPQSSTSEATIDIKLPRRSLLVQFSCNICGERTQRLVNRLAYERGTVFVQCAGCLQHHKLVDNLGLIVEYDLKEDISLDSDADQV